VNNERAGRAGTGQQRLQRGPDLAGGRDRRASFEHVALHVNEEERGSHGSILARARRRAVVLHRNRSHSAELTCLAEPDPRALAAVIGNRDPKPPDPGARTHLTANDWRSVLIRSRMHAE